MRLDALRCENAKPCLSQKFEHVVGFEEPEVILSTVGVDLGHQPTPREAQAQRSRRGTRPVQDEVPKRPR